MNRHTGVNNSHYSSVNVDKILMAYKSIFPDIAKLTDYLDLKSSPSRKWSCLTTDFSKIDFDTLSRFDKSIYAIEKSGITCETQLGYEFMRLSDKFSIHMKYKVGFSLGISTWTDFLLEKTFSSDKKDILIILGHDWYPIISNLENKRDDDLDEKHPLKRNAKCLENNYGKAIPEKLRKNKICLFLNLYPDFRPPASNTTGKCLTNLEYKYYVNCFEELCNAITDSQKYKITGIISWGNAVWEALRDRVRPTWQNIGIKKWSSMGIMKAVEFHEGRPFEFGEKKLPFYPFAHPSFGTNFLKQTHYEIFNKTIENLNSEVLR